MSLLLVIVVMAPGCLFFQDAVSENIGQVYGAKSDVLTIEGTVASTRAFGEATVDDPPVLGHRYPFGEEPEFWLVFEKNELGVVVARILDESDNEEWVGDFLGYVGKRRSTAWGFRFGSRTTGDADVAATE
ncbi:MAG: hypothetical protein ACYTGZ_17080 [Planctomycetota bacterium]|jgi:hypothetical protein